MLALLDFNKSKFRVFSWKSI